jgi:hypothetical protein
VDDVQAPSVAVNKNGRKDVNNTKCKYCKLDWFRGHRCKNRPPGKKGRLVDEAQFRELQQQQGEDDVKTTNSVNKSINIYNVVPEEKSKPKEYDYDLVNNSFQFRQLYPEMCIMGTRCPDSLLKYVFGGLGGFACVTIFFETAQLFLPNSRGHSMRITAFVVVISAVIATVAVLMIKYFLSKPCYYKHIIIRENALIGGPMVMYEPRKEEDDQAARKPYDARPEMCRAGDIKRLHAFGEFEILTHVERDWRDSTHDLVCIDGEYYNSVKLEVNRAFLSEILPYSVDSENITVTMERIELNYKTACNIYNDTSFRSQRAMVNARLVARQMAVALRQQTAGIRVTEVSGRLAPGLSL